jgi:hypothetical protein
MASDVLPILPGVAPPGQSHRFADMQNASNVPDDGRLLAAQRSTA